MGVIIVGVDRSAGAEEALRFAFEEAQLRGATLRAVHAWQFGYIGAPSLEGAVPVRAAEAVLDAMVREAIPEAGDIRIERRVVEGAAAAVLVEESRGADLLVVGSRGHGGFAQLLLGSVSQQCAHHAECPVVIVRPRAGRH